MKVYPRLDQGLLGRLIAEYRRMAASDSVGEAVSSVSAHVEEGVLAPGRISHSPVGVVLVSESDLSALRERLRAVASEYGYPEARYGDASPKWADYDCHTARVLHGTMDILPADAGSREVWAHMNGWLVPDLVLWRWWITEDRPKGGDARFGEGPRWHARNQMGRLWWRQEILGDLYSAGTLGEDQLTAIIERPSLGFNPPLARAIARQWTSRTRGGSAGAEDLMRDATKRLRRVLPYQSVYSLSENDLDDVVSRAFEEAEVALGAGGPR